MKKQEKYKGREFTVADTSSCPWRVSMDGFVSAHARVEARTYGAPPQSAFLVYIVDDITGASGASDYQPTVDGARHWCYDQLIQCEEKYDKASPSPTVDDLCKEFTDRLSKMDDATTRPAPSRGRGINASMPRMGRPTGVAAQRKRIR